MTRDLVILTDIGDTVIDEGTEVRLVAEGVVQRAECIPGARETLLALYERGFTIVMCADGLVASFRNTMTQHGLEHVFAGKAISEAVGADKPDARMFAAAMQAAGLTEADKGRMIMVGNNIRRDVTGANRFGIRPVLLDWSPRYGYVPENDEQVPAYVIHSPQELLPLAEKLDAALQGQVSACQGSRDDV